MTNGRENEFEKLPLKPYVSDSNVQEDEEAVIPLIYFLTSIQRINLNLKKEE